MSEGGGRGGAEQVVEAVPNFSEGRDPAFLDAAAAVFERAGCEVLHATMDPDHHRSVVTAIGAPLAVERAALAAAELALRRIDLRRHRGAHPRVGALDVLPLVPLHGIGMDAVAHLARRVGARIAELGVPVRYYGRASRPPGRALASIRRPGLGGGAPGADGHVGADGHPTAGTFCVGARRVLLAWNVDVEGVTLDHARAVAARLREAGGGFAGLRALGLRLERQRRLQISMNLEDPARTAPLDVFAAIEREIGALGGRVVGTEVIGMYPDEIARPGAAERMNIRDHCGSRVLSARVAAHLRARRARSA